MSTSTESDTAKASGFVRRLRLTVAWLWTHKVKSILLLLVIYLAFELLTIPYFEIARLASWNPTETALMNQRIEEAEDQGKTLRISHRWIPLSRIPPHVVKAVVVAEDGMFYSHGGVDWFEVKESIEKNLEEGRAARGASTITQQLAKNLYLSTSKTPLRKVKEVVITFLLEGQLSKQRILELYLNLIEWGRGIFGIEAASRTYFGKSASELTLDEAVRLAAVIPSPLLHRPDADSRYVLRRKGIVLARMRGGNTMRSLTTNEELTDDFQPAAPESLQLEPTTSVDLEDTTQNTAGPDTALPPELTDSTQDGHDGL